IEGEYPLAARLLDAAVTLRRGTAPVRGDDARAEALADLHRAIAAAGIDHDALVGPLHRGEAAADHRFLVLGDDDDRERRFTCGLAHALLDAPPRAYAKATIHAKRRPSAWSSATELNSPAIAMVSTIPRSRSRLK